MQLFHLDIIGTHLLIQIDTSVSCETIFSEIHERLENFEKNFSRFIPGNWLHQLNRERQAILDQDARTMLKYALVVSRDTDGYFDLTVGKRLTELGYGNQKMYEGISLVSQMDKQGSAQRANFGDYRDIEIQGDQVILGGDVLLEFGGVGKGYLIDIIQGMLDKFPRFLINFGGDMYGRGSWKIGLESPFASDEVIGTMVLDDIFIACSAGTRRKWGTHHHLIDPHTGASSQEVVASYIEGNSGMITDTYATTLCVMPWERACATLTKTPEISGVIVSKNGNIYQKEGSRAEVFE